MNDSAPCQRTQFTGDTPDRTTKISEFYRGKYLYVGPLGLFRLLITGKRGGGKRLTFFKLNITIFQIIDILLEEGKPLLGMLILYGDLNLIL